MIIFLYALSTFLVVYSMFGLTIMQPVIDANVGYFAVVHFVCLMSLLAVGSTVLLILTLTTDERGNQ